MLCVGPDGGEPCAAHEPLPEGCHGASGWRARGEDKEVTLHGSI